jgi:uncharacterized phage protein (TIGR02220 family)
MQGVTMGRYRKIDTRTWNDKKFNELSDYGKLAFFLLLTHPHLTPIGAMRASLPGLAGEIHWPLKKLRDALEESCKRSMVHYDESSSFMWLPNFLKYNQPESPNVVRSWESYLDYLPECSLKNLLINHVNTYVESLSLTFQQALPKAFGKTMPNQEQEHKQEQEQEEKIMSDNPDVENQKSSTFLKSEKASITKHAIEVLNFLNEKTERAYRPVDANLKLIIARLHSGATVMDCRQVIAKKTREWRGDGKMAEYLRPATLFNATKFEQYMGELVVPKEGDDSHDIK